MLTKSRNKESDLRLVLAQIESGERINHSFSALFLSFSALFLFLFANSIFCGLFLFFLKGNKMIATYVKNQLGRASLSIMLNIAEGSAKFSARDRRNFLVTARGSVFECSSLINFLNSEGELSKDFSNDLYSAFEEISRILYTMIKNLENVKS